MDDTTSPTSPMKSERGQALVELALVLPVLFLILFGTIQFGHAFWTFQQVSSSASEGARKAAVSRAAADPTAAVVTAVQNASPNLTAGDLGVAVESTWTSGDPVTVQVTYPVDITVMGITFYNGSVTSERTSRVE